MKDNRNDEDLSEGEERVVSDLHVLVQADLPTNREECIRLTTYLTDAKTQRVRQKDKTTKRRKGGRRRRGGKWVAD